MEVSPLEASSGPGWASYRDGVERLLAQYGDIAPGSPVRLAKATSNLFRTRSPSPGPGLDVAAFDGVMEVDPLARTAQVQGMTTYEHLVDATLAHGLMPLVVPQLKTITVGGALSGLGIESSSWRNGFPHESVREIDVLTGDGRVVTARRDNEHRDLFAGFPNSYGTLGYALRLELELEPAHPFVHVRHVPFSDVAILAAALEEVCATGEHAGEEVAFVDGTLFSPGESYLTLGSWADEAPATSDYTLTRIYYRSLRHLREDWLTARGYLWRWDTDWFWCSRAFGVQKPAVRRLLGRRHLRSDVYWRAMALEERYHFKRALDRRRRLPDRETVIQDVEVPVDRLGEFVTNFAREVPISPIWLCPLRQRDPASTWPLYRMDPGALYVNVGFWSTVPEVPGEPTHHNRWVEDEVDRLGGRKSLYSSAFYSEDRFWQLYNGPAYRVLKDRYDPDGRLLDLYAKCVQSR